MADEQEQAGGRVRRRTKLNEPLDWGRFWWKDWVGTAAIRRLTRDMRGGLADVRAFTYGTPTPGVMDEDDVRAWAGYTPEEWKKVRDLFARVFNLKRKRGKWVLDDIVQDYAASVEVYLRSQERAQKDVAGRRRRKDLATTGTTSGAPEVQLQVGPPVTPQVQPQVDKTLEVEKLDSRLQTQDKPDSESDSRAARAQSLRSRAGSAGVAGSSSRQSALEPIVERALQGRPPANGGSA